MKLTRKQLRLLVEALLNESEPITLFLLSLGGEALMAFMVSYIAATNYKFLRNEMTVRDYNDIFTDIDADQLALTSKKVPAIVAHAQRCQDAKLLKEIEYFTDSGKKILDVFAPNYGLEMSKFEKALTAAEGLLAGTISLKALAAGLTTISSASLRAFRKVAIGAQALSLAGEATLTEDQINKLDSIDFERMKNSIYGFDQIYEQIVSSSGFYDSPDGC